MRKIILFLMCLNVFFWTSCSKENSLDVKKAEVASEIDFDDFASVHSMVLDCAKEILKKQDLTGCELTEAQLYAVTESAVLDGVQRYVAKKEGRTLTSTEQNTLKKEVNNYWYDSSNRTLMKRLSQSSKPIDPITGSSDLNALYKNFSIKKEAQGYLNKMFGNIDSSRYEEILDQLYIEVWSGGAGLSDEEKLSIMNVISVTKDSYKYWNSNIGKTRLSGTAKGIIYSDAAGALRGLWKGIGRSVGNLIFGPGGAVLTIGGSVLVNAAMASVEAGIIAGLVTL